MFQAATIGIFLTLNTIVPVRSSKPDANYKLEKTFENIRSSIDSKVAENGYFKSFLSPDQGRKSNTDFSQLHEDVDEHMAGLGFNFDQNDYDNLHLPQKRPVQPKFLLNYEPLRPSNYISAPSTRYSDYPFSTPEHQDDGGDGDDGGDDGDGGGGGGGGNGGGGGGGNGGGGGGGNGGGGGGNGGGGGGGNGGNGGGGGGGNGGIGNGDLGEGDDGRFLEQQSFEQDYDNFEPHNGWRPIHNKIQGSDVLENPFRIKPLAKKVPGYGSNRVPVTSNSYQKPYKQRAAYKKKQPQRFADDPYTRRLVQNKRPLRVYDDDDDVEPLKLRGNSRRPLRLNKEKGRLAYNNIRKNKLSKIMDEDTEEADEPRPLQSRRFPTKKRQVCQKIKKSMTPNDIEDHEIIGRKMSCMVCKDLVSGGSYEKCSYNSDPISDEHFKDPEEINKFKSNRFKRRVVLDRKRKQPESGEEVEDYEYDNVNAQESEEDPEYVQNADTVADYDSEDPENYETAENESDEYRLPPIKSSTCRKVMKEGNVCNVCQDNLSNRQYEQCEYEDDPKKNAYEYSTRNLYGKPRYKRQLDSDRTYNDYFNKLFPELGSNRKSSLATKFSSKDGDFGFLDNGKIGFKKTKSLLLGDKDLSIDFDSGEESPVNRMLGDFRNKDRSNCKKSLKDKMTCYKCKNDKGSETEECMYITDNTPKDRKQSYHETKKFNSSPDEEKSTGDADKSNENHKQQQPSSSSLTHVYAPLFGSNYEPTAQYSHVRPQYRNRNYRLHRKPVTEELEESTEDDDQTEAQSVEEYDYADDPSSKQVSRHDLPDVDPFGPEGAYSEETVPVYDPTLRTWLPRYMVIKSSEEAMVDAELGFD